MCLFGLRQHCSRMFQEQNGLPLLQHPMTPIEAQTHFVSAIEGVMENHCRRPFNTAEARQETVVRTLILERDSKF